MHPCEGEVRNYSSPTPIKQKSRSTAKRLQYGKGAHKMQHFQLWLSSPRRRPFPPFPRFSHLGGAPHPNLVPLEPPLPLSRRPREEKEKNQITRKFSSRIMNKKFKNITYCSSKIIRCSTVISLMICKVQQYDTL